MPPRRTFLAATGLAAAGTALATPALAQSAAWPNRPVRFIVPFAAGGPVEPPARLCAEYLTQRLGQPVIVETRGGAGGALGAQAVIAANDGHTFLFGTSFLVIQPALQPDIGYDPQRDLVPVSLVLEAPMTFSAKPGARVRDFPGLLALARAKPGEVTYGSSGIGTTTHMVGALFALRAGVQMTHVPYRGAGQMIGAFLAGDIDIMSAEISTALPHAREGRAVVLAQSGETRSPLLPDVPLTTDLVPGTAMPIWFALMGSRNTPPEAIARLTAELAPLRENSTLATRTADNGGRLLLTPPDALAARLATDLPLWRDVVREAGVKPE